jgi:hypothetical protein
MTPEETQVSDQLQQLASSATPPRFTADELTSRIRRRRGARQAVIAVGCVSALVGAGLAATSVFGPQSSRDGLTTASGGPHRPSPTSSGLTDAEKRNRTPIKVHALSCGDMLTGPLVTQAAHGMKITAANPMTKTTDGSPKLPVQIVSGETVKIMAPLAPTLLVTHSGRIVALSRDVDNTPPGVPSVSGSVGADYTLSPDHPYPVTLQGNVTPCPGLTWTQIWDAPTSYEVAVVLPIQALGLGAQESDPLLIATSPLKASR